MHLVNASRVVEIIRVDNKDTITCLCNFSKSIVFCTASGCLFELKLSIYLGLVVLMLQSFVVD